jgi:hypothetical protein
MTIRAVVPLIPDRLEAKDQQHRGQTLKRQCFPIAAANLPVVGMARFLALKEVEVSRLEHRCREEMMRNLGAVAHFLALKEVEVCRLMHQC